MISGVATRMMVSSLIINTGVCGGVGAGLGVGAGVGMGVGAEGIGRSPLVEHASATTIASATATPSR